MCAFDMGAAKSPACPGGHTDRPYGDRRGCGVQWLGRCVQHGLQENSIAPGGVVYQDMGDGSQ